VGTCARVTWARTDPENLERMVDAYKTSLMPSWEETPGFCSNSLLVDRRTGHCAGSVVFESRGAMEHTRDQFTTLREDFARKMGLFTTQREEFARKIGPEILEVAEFDLVLADLRVPETV
jgi:hypothetical protein